MATAEARILEFKTQNKIEVEKLEKYFSDLTNIALEQLRAIDWSQLKFCANSNRRNGTYAEYYSRLITIVQGLKFASDVNIHKELSQVVNIGSLRNYFVSYQKINELINVLYQRLDPVLIYESFIFELVSYYLDIKIDIEISEMAGLVKYENGINGVSEKSEMLELFKKLQRRKRIEERKTVVQTATVSNELHYIIQELQKELDPNGAQIQNYLNEIAKNRIEKIFAIEIASTIIVLTSKLAKKAIYDALFDFFKQIFSDFHWLSEFEFDKKTIEGNIEFYSSYRGDYSRYKYRQVASLLKI